MTGNCLIIPFALSEDVSYVQRIDFGMDAGGLTYSASVTHEIALKQQLALCENKQKG